MNAKTDPITTYSECLVLVYGVQIKLFQSIVRERKVERQRENGIFFLSFVLQFKCMNACCANSLFGE